MKQKMTIDAKLESLENLVLHMNFMLKDACESLAHMISDDIEDTHALLNHATYVYNLATTLKDTCSDYVLEGDERRGKNLTKAIDMALKTSSRIIEEITGKSVEDLVESQQEN